MLQALFNKIGRAAVTAGKGAATCPRCEGDGKTTGQTYTCSSCGFVGAPLEWFPNNSYKVPKGKAGSPPVITRIKKLEPTPGATTFEIPASKRSGGLILFGIIFLSILIPITLIFLSLGTGSLSGDIPEEYRWLVPFCVTLFLIVFWVAGLVVLYHGLVAKYSKHLLLLRDNHLVHGREFFWTKKATTFPLSEISSIAAIEFYQENYTPVFGVEIRSPKKKVRFGSSLTNDEKGWLVAELNHLVFPPAKEPEATSKLLPGESISHSPFEVLIPRPKKKPVDWLGAPIGLVISGAFIFIGLSPLMADEPEFRFIWISASSLFAFIILVVLAWQGIQRTTQKSIVSDGTHLFLRKVRHHRTHRERQLLPLVELDRLALYPIGSANAETRYAASLITATQVIPLFRWLPRDLAQDVVQELRRKLHLPLSTFSE